MATAQEKITALYVAYFDRAPDYEGLESWLNAIEGSDDATVIAEISALFAQHPYFDELYGGMDNEAFVRAIYENVLGNSGDSEGIAYWSALLESGTSRSDMVASFVTTVLDFDPNDPAYADLSAADLEAALARAELLNNKVDVALYYAQELQEKTTITDLDNLESDPAYEASINILSEVTTESSSVTEAKELIDTVALLDEPISVINDLPTISPTALSLELAKQQFSTTATQESVSFETEGVSSLISGDQWEQTTITYSFNETLPQDYYSYPNAELTTGFTPLDDAQQDAVRSIMDDLDAMLAVDFVEVADGGDIAFNIVDMDPWTSGFAFTPGDTYSYQGDVFLSSAFNTDPQSYGLEPGEEGYTTIVHELGHALGLKHPFEGYNPLPSDLDDTNHTVMSYTTRYDIQPELSYTSAHRTSVIIEYPVSYPDFFSAYDVAALGYMYGLEPTDSDDTYTFSYDAGEIITIVDTGGTDTLDLSATTGQNIIDLTPGSINSADMQSIDAIVAAYQEDIAAHNITNADTWIEENIISLADESLLYTGKDALGISAQTVIENVITGTNDDIIRDNFVDNTIETGAGDDAIYLGSGGFDTVDGGSGIDTLFLDTQEFTLEDQADGSYLLVAQSYAAELQGIEYIDAAGSLEAISEYLV